MVDAVDSKSTEGNLLRVRVSPPVPKNNSECSDNIQSLNKNKKIGKG